MGNGALQFGRLVETSPNRSPICHLPFVMRSIWLWPNRALPPRSSSQTRHSSGFFRVYPESLVWVRRALFIARMADPDVGRSASIKIPLNATEPPAVGQKSNWLRSVAAGMAILALSSFSAVLIFDWYFFSVMDGIAADLRPVVGAFHPNGHDARPTRWLRARQPVAPEKTPDRSEQHINARLVPVRTIADPKPSGN
jgi:hypothetical protein